MTKKHNAQQRAIFREARDLGNDDRLHKPVAHWVTDLTPLGKRYHCAIHAQSLVTGLALTRSVVVSALGHIRQLATIPHWPEK